LRPALVFVSQAYVCNERREGFGRLPPFGRATLSCAAKLAAQPSRHARKAASRPVRGAIVAADYAAELRLIDAKRLRYKIGTVPEEDFVVHIKEKIRRLIA
jgi:hypothetical protein